VKDHRGSRFWILLIALSSFSGAVCAAPADDALNALYQYYEACRSEEITAYMQMMDFSDGEDLAEGHVEIARDLTLAVWETYDILRQDVSNIEVSVDEEAAYALISYHIYQEVQGDDSEGNPATAIMDMDYVALMHHVETWKVVYLMPRVTFEENMQNLSSVIAVADAIGGLAEEQEPGDIEDLARQQESGNLPPTASFALMPKDPKVGDPIVIVSTSSDPDGDPLMHTWYVNGEYEISAGDLSEWTWSSPGEGEYTIGLIVMDGKGGIDEHADTITVVGDGEEDVGSGSGGMNSLLYLLVIPVAAAVAILVVRRRRRR
jgi:hypothetical protein